MIRTILWHFSLAAAALIGAFAIAPPAQAWWYHGGGWGYRGGVFIGIAPPLYVGPPVVYAPPPVVYAPPPVVYTPPAGQSCYAGAYVCPLDAPAAVGAPCSCPANRGRVYGKVR